MNQGRAAWTSFDRIDRESAQGKFIGLVLGTANFGFLESEALKIRSELKPHTEGAISLKSHIDKNTFAAGWFNLVLRVEFSDATRWIARIPYRPREEGEVLACEANMLSEITTMSCVRSRTSIPVPEVYGFNVSTSNTFGFPYMLIEEMNGHHLETVIGKSVPSNKLAHIAREFANLLRQLNSLRFSRIGRLWSGWNMDQEPTVIGVDEIPLQGEPSSTNTEFGPHVERNTALRSSLEHFFQQARTQRREILALRPGNRDYEAAAIFLEQCLWAIVREDYVYGPFPLYHQDMHYNNILVDDDYNIVAVLDWDGVQTAPVEQFVVLPEFITFPGLSAEENAPITEFRRLVVKALRDQEHESQERNSKETQDSINMDSKCKASIADLIESPCMELASRSLVSGIPVRALPYAQLCVRLMHGIDVSWENVREDILSAPIHRNH